ncbi:MULTISPECIES: hypothetical protein [Cyanophyceae]|uniref:hypothetical protein n=1 Tax=Cyanophyceae TaxID=3028117 RepID=UPI0016848EF3|nr:hypothetical protein [Trichocoleus sp. FACHB-40]MBD2001668.1 hypothetical protein [Trichocoleus sp. FACHB-40]
MFDEGKWLKNGVIGDTIFDATVAKQQFICRLNKLLLLSILIATKASMYLDEEKLELR